MRMKIGRRDAHIRRREMDDVMCRIEEGDRKSLRTDKGKGFRNIIRKDKRMGIGRIDAQGQGNGVRICDAQVRGRCHAQIKRRW